MAKVFEALLQSREHSPDQTKKFLDDFDFGNTKSDNVFETAQLTMADMPIPSGESFDDEEIPTSFFDSVSGTVAYAETVLADTSDTPVASVNIQVDSSDSFAVAVSEPVEAPEGYTSLADSPPAPEDGYSLGNSIDPVAEESPGQALAPVYPLFPGLREEIAPPTSLETDHFAVAEPAQTLSSEQGIGISSEAELPLFALPVTESAVAEQVYEPPFQPAAELTPAELPKVNDLDMAAPKEALAGSLAYDLAALNSEEQETPVPVMQEVQPPAIETPPPVVHRVPSEFIKLSEIIHKAAESSPLKVLLVSSAEQNESADFVTKNLCLALSENSSDKIGFLDLALPARRNRKIDEAVDFRIRIHKTPISNLREIIPDGGPVSVSGLFTECDVVQLFQTLRSRFDFLVIKAPSVAAVPEVRSLASMVDGVILSADKDSAHSGALDEVKARLKASNARILGTLLNRHRDPRTNIAA